MAEDFKAFVDRELAPEEMERVNRLLAESEEARTEVSQLEALSKAIPASESIPEPTGLEATLAALESKATPATARVPFWRRRVWATVSVLVLGVLLVPTLIQSGAGVGTRSGAEAGLDGVASAPMDASVAATEEKAKSADGGPQFQERAPAEVQGEAFARRRAAPADIAPGSGSNSSLPDLAAPPMVIRTGNMGVKVPDAAEAQKKTVELARELGGFVQDSNLSRDPNSKQDFASVTIRVPENRFETAMNRMAAFGEVLERNVSGQDVGAQVVDLEARLRALRAEEEQYLTLLKATTKIGDILSVKDRLSQVRMQIESIDASRKHLRNAAAMSTITVSYSEPVQVKEGSKDPSWVDESWAGAFNRLNAAGAFLGRLAINAFVLSPIWIPIVFIGWLIARRK